jgi:TATA-box binding protein (TBP) (component of TFIID and TFIIIB)
MLSEITENENMSNEGSKLKFPEFEENKVSTKTIIAVTNIQLDIHKVFDCLPLTDYAVLPKKRGRKKKEETTNLNADISNGSIITIKLENKIRGVDLKKKSKSSRKKVGKFFRNSVTIVMVINNKRVNFKVSRNGKFQMTGCKSDEQAEECVKFFWTFIKEHKHVYTFTRGDVMEIMFVPAMRNIDFDLGFLVDREKLSRHVNLMTSHYSMLESSFGYTGANIKFRIDEDLYCLDVKKIAQKDDTWLETLVPYTDHLEFISEKERDKKLNKKRYITFLVFQSGRCIESGMCAEYMKGPYEKFIQIIKDCYNDIKEDVKGK